MTRFPSGLARLGALALFVAVIAALTGFLGACGDSGQAGLTGDVSLPSDFPTGEVPLLDGRLIQATGTKPDGWSLTIQGTATGTNVLDAAVEKLTKSGFTESSRTEAGGTRTVILSSKKGRDTYWVTVGSSPRAAGGPNSVFYQVTLS
ncbi:hypothetical protein [Gordonia crocea]|uniref:hypothetical protein n=1 Tax=Gordonia crocea TaxID=589162 RepID=UPI001379A9C1|nr:hypothetical protein [Gordonia crocea]